jgi:hypothetical protein
MPGEGLTHGPPGSKKPGGSHHRISRIIRHSLRDGFNGVLRALPGEPGFLAPITSRSYCLLDTSVGVSGPHDFAVRIGIARLAKPTRPSQPRLTFGDDWPQRPLHRGGMAGRDHTFLKNGTQIFFARRLDTDSAFEGACEFRFFAHVIAANGKRLAHGGDDQKTGLSGESVARSRRSMLQSSRSSRSWPKNMSSPATKLGTPKIPRA